MDDNQRLAHDFEHGRQVLDGELSFKFNPLNGTWNPFARDMIDEAKGFAVGFGTEAASPGQGTIINGAATALNSGGLSAEAKYLGDHIGGYSGTSSRAPAHRTTSSRARSATPTPRLTTSAPAGIRAPRHGLTRRMPFLRINTPPIRKPGTCIRTHGIIRFVMSIQTGVA